MARTRRRRDSRNQLLPAVLDFSSLGDGDMPARLKGSTWAISSGAAVNTPVVTEDLSNTGLEAPYTAGVANGWQADQTPTLTEETTIVHGGSSSQKIVADTANEGIKESPASSPPEVVGRLLHVAGWFYPLTSVGGRIFRLTNDIEARAMNAAGHDAWEKVQGTLFTEGTSSGVSVSFRRQNVGTVYVDDASQGLITMANLYSIMETGQANVGIRANWTSGTYELTGIILRADSLTNPQTGVLVWHNGTQVLIGTLSGGLITRVGSAAAVTYVAGATLEVQANGSSIVVKYDGVQVRSETIASYTDQTKHGLFSTDPACSCSYLEIQPPPFNFAT